MKRKICNEKEVISILQRVYNKTRNRHTTILLACKVLGQFTRADIYYTFFDWWVINKNNFDTYFDSLVTEYKKGDLPHDVSRTVKKTGKKLNGHYQYTLTIRGEQLLSSLYPIEAYQLGTLLVPTEGKLDVFNNITQVEADKMIAKQGPSEDKIIRCCNYFKDLLIDKNRRYGDSSLSPPEIFNIPHTAKMEARLEDKLARLSVLNIDDNYDEYIDTVRDLVGYFMLYYIKISGNFDSPLK